MIRIFIGFDPREAVAFSVLSHSIHRHASKPVSIAPLMLSQLQGQLVRERDPLQSTDFSFSRFLVPSLSGFSGWSIFMDCDMLVLEDIARLWALRDERYAVMCVRHDHCPVEDRKFLNAVQTQYAKKNWSSVMLFNNARCTALTPEYVSSASGLELHQFKWLADDGLIGALPARWNHLVGYNSPEPAPALVHYTQGGPYFDEYAQCEHAGGWRAELESMLRCEQRQPARAAAGPSDNPLFQTAPVPSARSQCGQALIEFAIILTLLVLLLAGGVELGTAAINSNQAREAAQQGGQQWSEVVGASGLYVSAAPSPYAIGNGAVVPAPATVGLGDHEPSSFARPACDDLACTAPTNGLLGTSATLNPPIDPATGVLTDDLYLFNPLPIDVTNCVVNDAVQYTDCVNRIFEGCGPPACPATVAGLPRLNAALRGLYTLRCLNAADAQVVCRSVASGGTAVTWLLRLPGRHDVATDDTVRLALLDDASNVAAEVPIFEIECAAAGGNFIDAGGNPCDSRAAPAEVCWTAAGTALACRVRVKVRYRHQFFALLASAFFDGDPLPEATAAALDRGEVNAAGVPVGGYGAEVTAQELASAAPRYFKVPWRTFQGCFSTRTVRDGGSGLRGSIANCN